MLWPGWERHLVVGAMTLYPVLLLWVYRNTISVNSSGRGFVYHQPEALFPLVTAFLLAILPAVVMPLVARRPGVVIIWVLYIVAYVPSQLIPTVTIDASQWQLMRLQMALAFGFGVLVTANALPALRLPTISVPTRMFWTGLIGIAAVMLVVVIWYLGLPSSLPAFSEVYDVRDTFMSKSDSAPLAIAYVWSWLGQAILPIVVAYGIVWRYPLLLLSGIAGQIVLYGMSGAKSLVFSIALIIVLSVLLRLFRDTFGALVSIGACLLILGAVMVDRLLETTWMTGLFVRRFLVTPGLLTGYYYDFFAANPKTVLSHSVLSPFFDYPYNTTVAYIIGERYLNEPETMANANIWADGYANFGFLGVLIVSLVAGGIIWAFNGLSLRHGYVLTGAVAGAISLTLANTSVFTAMLTHGIALTLFVLWLMPDRGARAESRSDVAA